MQPTPSSTPPTAVKHMRPASSCSPGPPSPLHFTATADALDDAIAKTTPADPGPATPLTVTDLRRSHPAKRLLAHAPELPAGSRGHRGFVDLLPESAGHHFVTRASYPVVVLEPVSPHGEISS